jgi:hypothetical protein
MTGLWNPTAPPIAQQVTTGGSGTPKYVLTSP